ncbi:hypothetical protein LLH00_18905 [bacterium]|nr:hypothetical protein [bacterium]
MPKTVAVLVLSFAFALIHAASGFAAPGPDSVHVRVTPDSSGAELPFLNCGVMGDLSATLLPEGLELMEKLAATTGRPLYRRLMCSLSSGTGFPSSTNVYQIGRDRRPIYDFTLFDQIFDRVVQSRMVPFVCLSFMPDSLSAAPPEGARRDWDYIDRYPPRDWKQWQELVRNVAAHCAERYGADKVTLWRWEVWNEPDLEFYWHASAQDYCRLYDHAAAGLRAALPGAKVGGCALAGPDSKAGAEFLETFVRHCLEGKNYASGGNGAPLDFITFHMKGGGSRKLGDFTSEALRGKLGYERRSPDLEGMLARTRATLDHLARIPGCRGIPVIISECDIDFGVSTSVYEDPNVEYRNSEYFPAFQCALAARMTALRDEMPDNPLEGLFMDTFFFPGRRPFEGQRTLLTAFGIEKPVLNALRVLGRLEGRRLNVSVEGSPDVTGLGAVASGNLLRLALVNFNPQTGADTARAVALELAAPGAHRLSMWRIDREHSNSYSLWQARGAALGPDRNLLAELHRRMGLEKAEPDRQVFSDGPVLHLSLNLPPHSVSLLELRPVK